jgi:hypothetical protein
MRLGRTVCPRDKSLVRQHNVDLFCEIDEIFVTNFENKLTANRMCIMP